MAKHISLEIDDTLESRARAYAERRGISLDQLVAQQLERAVSNDEYANARRQVTRSARATRNASEQILRSRIRSAND